MGLKLSRAAVWIVAALGAAVGPTEASSQVNGVTVTQVSIYSSAAGNDGVVVYFSPGIPNLEGCTNTAGNALWIDFSYTTQPDGKTLYSSLLAAELAGKAVTFGVSGCGASGQFPTIYRMDVVI
jgi:hypothetical protein